MLAVFKKKWICLPLILTLSIAAFCYFFHPIIDISPYENGFFSKIAFLPASLARLKNKSRLTTDDPKPKDQFSISGTTFSSVQQKEKCQPKTDIVFHKTHKCSSTSIQNFLMRYAKDHNLNLVLPKVANYLPDNDGFKASKLSDTLWYRSKMAPDIFCLHNRWNGPEVGKLFHPKEPYYFSILRDPVSLFVSLWDYYALSKYSGMNLKQFIALEDKPEALKKPDHFNYKHSLLSDFGVDIHHHDNETFIQEKIAEIDKTFHLILMVENFRESMVLLKHELCWDYADIASLKLNAYDERKKSKISPSEREKLKKWLKTSYMFYDYFKAKFDKKLKAFGEEKMNQELIKLDHVNEQAEKDCKIQFVPRGRLPKIDRPWGPSSGILGYIVRGLKEHSYCEWMAIQELKFVELMRKRQNAKAMLKLKRQKKK